jgi:DNA-binding XRE family transcriptional regulator
MTKNEFCQLVQEQLKDLRKEFDLRQDVMADTIGVSKKTYIQLEKARVRLKWAETVSVVTVFKDSQVINDLFGSDVCEIVQAIALQKMPRRQFITMGGKVWWNTLHEASGFTLQQHKISKHFRILDADDYRVYFSILKEDAWDRLNRYLGKEGE